MPNTDFSKRSSQQELMDEPDVNYDEFDDCLQELERINFFTLAYRPTLIWVKNVIKSGALKNLSVMDVGSGRGDMLRRIACWAKRNKKSIAMCGVDINPWSKRSAETLSSGCLIFYETSDIFQFSPDRKVDVIISSLFVHHLSDAMLVEFIKWMDRHAVHGWFINDLHRHPVPYYFIKFAVLIFSRNRLIKSDAPISVLRSFRRKDWEVLLEKATIPKENIVISWYFPFRYCVARRK